MRRDNRGLTEDLVVPTSMSTQHPDNAANPPWAEGEVIEGDTELHEAYFAYHALRCNEVMWDSEGKDVDTHVMRKLLSAYPDFFQKEVIGEDVFLTYRIPNPQIEKAERKIVTETLQTIPLSSDVASLFYKRKVVPIFEVILPFTTSGQQLLWIHDYYRKVIAGAQGVKLAGSMTVKNWVGAVSPKSIRVIPLVEDMESLLVIDTIVTQYLRAVKTRHLRVFIARSDPALNYGLFCAVLLSKIALSRLQVLQQKSGVRIYPIIGVGSMPFRGHLSPDNVKRFLAEYKGLATATTQSALRYDYPVEKAKNAVRALNDNLPNGEALVIGRDDEGLLRGCLEKFKATYQARVEELAPLVNSVASYVPQRRARKLHIGLFGYSRNVKGVAMPRAIPFAAAFYSLGIPPEFIGAEALRELDEKEWNCLSACYVNMKIDLGFAGNYVSWEGINMLMDSHERFAKVSGISRERLRGALAKLMADLAAVEETFSIKLGPHDHDAKRHENFINNFLISYSEGEHAQASNAFIEAAQLRRCLG